MNIYFSHPTFTFKTKTEKKCIEIIEEYLEPDKLINPSDFGIKHDLKSKLKESDAIVAMAVSSCFTYLVWNEIEMIREEKEEDLKIYTFMVENRENIGPLVEGVPEEIKKLSKEQSKKLSHEIQKDDYQDGLISSLVGSHSSRF